MREKVVSIIMPVHNAGKFVRHAIQSVLDQSYSKWELVIIDDGSGDNSLEEINSFNDGRIILFKQEHRGVSAARNRGLAHMTGEFFCFLDADDVLPPRSLEGRLSVFAGAIDFVDGTVETFDSSMQSRLRRWKPSANGKVLSKLCRLSGSCFFGLTWMVRRRPGLRYHFDESLRHCEDLLFFMSIADTGQYAFTDQTVLYYRRSPNSAMTDVRGLANGYSALRFRIHLGFRDRVSFFDKFLYDYKVRKIILLSFLRRSQYKEAALYLTTGRL